MNLQGILDGIRDCDFHEGGIVCLQLFVLERSFFASLSDEVLALCHTQDGSDPVDPRHVTSWTQPYGQVRQFSLMNRSGRYDDFSTDHDLSTFGKRFRGAASYPALARFIDAFPHSINFRVNMMGRHAGLAPHEENVVFRTRTGGVGIRARFHLPVATNPDAVLTLEGGVYHLNEGTVYFVNNGSVHSAANRSDSLRIHLVWDMLLTREVADLMFGESGDLAIPTRRLVGAGRDVPVQRTEPPGEYRRQAGTVTRDEARAVTFCEVQ